jgi:NADH-quinone oxidoreductase subunit J
MDILFYISSAFAVFATLKVITNKVAIHALLYFIVSLLSVAVVLFILGAPFIAALEVIIYAGAIMVLFVFVVMMLNLGKETVREERQMLTGKMFIGPAIISTLLLAEIIYILVRQSGDSLAVKMIAPATVGQLLFTKYLLVTELGAFLLVSGIMGAYHLGEKEKLVHHRFLKTRKESI